MPTARPGAAWTPLTGSAHLIALEVLLDGPLPRSELARRLDLSAGSLTRLCKPLLDSGLLVETDSGAGGAGSGRPTRPLDVDERSHHFVGVKLTADTAYAVLTTLRATVLARAEAPLPDCSAATVTATVAGLVRSLTSPVDAVSVADVRAVGVGVGGLVDAAGTVVSAPFLDWTSVPFGPALERELGAPVVVDNDVLSLTRAEQWFGSARRCDHFAVITIGVGVGYALVVHDEVVAGPDAGVGLVGHHPLDPAGPLCPQGHSGCAGAMLTTEGIAARAAVAMRRPVGYDEVLDLAVEGEPVARRVVDDAARALGRLVAAVGNLAMPKMVVLTGDGVRLAEVGRSALHAGIRLDRSLRAMPLDVRVRPAGFVEWARGAAVTAIRTFVLGLRAEAPSRPG